MSPINRERSSTALKSRSKSRSQEPHQISRPSPTPPIALPINNPPTNVPPIDKQKGRPGRKPSKPRLSHRSSSEQVISNPADKLGGVQPVSHKTRLVTPPMALSDSEPEITNSNLPENASTTVILDDSSDLSRRERNLVIMSIQQQIDWNEVTNISGVSSDKVMKWWLKASSEMVRHG
jgi:hypothetical protein